MKNITKITKIALLSVLLLVTAACHDQLDELAENKSFTGDIDYSKSSDMILPLYGAYEGFQSLEWNVFPIVSVRGDDVNAGGLGDQQDFSETDKYNYNKDYWMYNSMWENVYKDILIMHSAQEQIELYAENGGDVDTANQYIAEAKTMRGFLLFQMSRVWGDVFITHNSDPTEMLVSPVSTKKEVMQHISVEMDVAIDALPSVHPNKRSDIRGGVTKYTALAIKALANLELENYQVVADATSEIINSGVFSLEADFYELFKLDGKLNNENILEIQFSDFGQGAGINKGHLFAFYGPENWTPSVDGASSGWGFYEPSLKYIKFMLDRNETVRLETSVLFTNRGINEIKSDPKYATLPNWISNTTRDGDQINDFARAMFSSGKHYLPSNQLTPGRTDYGTNKNITCIRYAEILLMYAEAITLGATGDGMSADAAVNIVRSRAGLSALSGVTTDQVLEEKFAELAMEWGTRYYDLVRLNKFSELSYEGRSFTEDKIYLPYPQVQVDKLPVLRGN